MPIIAKDKGGADFKKIPPGAHFAICNMVVDCGMQPGFNGKPQHKVYLRWEVPDERVEYTKDGVEHEGPCTIGRFYTVSLSQKATLRRDLENWRGRVFTDEELKGFDILNILGKCCQLMVTHAQADGKTYANVTGIMGISKDQRERAKNVKPENELLSFSLDSPDKTAFEKLPPWLREKIEQRMTDDAEPPVQAAASGEDFDDDIPF